MDINTLASTIRQSGSKTITVEHRAFKQGNKDGQGDYRILRLDLGNGNVIELTDQTGTWS